MEYNNQHFLIIKIMKNKILQTNVYCRHKKANIFLGPGRIVHRLLLITLVHMERYKNARFRALFLCSRAVLDIFLNLPQGWSWEGRMRGLSFIFSCNLKGWIFSYLIRLDFFYLIRSNSFSPTNVRIIISIYFTDIKTFFILTTWSLH